MQLPSLMCSAGFWPLMMRCTLTRSTISILTVVGGCRSLGGTSFSFYFSLLLISIRRWPVGVLPKAIVTSWKHIYSELASEEHGTAMRFVVDRTKFLCDTDGRTCCCMCCV